MTLAQALPALTDGGTGVDHSAHILVSGHAEIPRGTSLHEHYKVLGVMLQVDVHTALIVDVGFTFITPVVSTFVSGLVRGHYLIDLEPLCAEIDFRLQIETRHAIKRALHNAANRYLEFLRSHHLSVPRPPR